MSSISGGRGTLSQLGELGGEVTSVEIDPLLVHDAQEFVRDIEAVVSAEHARQLVLDIVEVRTRRSATQFLV